MDAPTLLDRDLLHVLSHTPTVWEHLRGARILVTGGTGFFGRWMLETFARANEEYSLGAQVTLLCRDPAKLSRIAPHLAAAPLVEVVPGDILKPLPQIACTHVLHMATETNVGLTDPTPREYYEASAIGTRHVLDLATACDCRRLLFTSSGAVYGRQPPDMERIPETYNGAPQPEDVTAGYGHGKRAAEFLCVAASETSALEVTIARCFAFAGPYMDLDSGFAIGNFIRDATSRDSIQVVGDGTPRRSYLYAADLAAWLWTILVRGESGRPYNVGSEHDVDIRTLAERVARIAGRGTPIEVASQPSRTTAPQRYVPSVARARRELGLRAWIDLDMAIERTVDWARTRRPATAGGSLS